MKKQYLYAGVSIFCWSTVAVVISFVGVGIVYITPFLSLVWATLFLREEFNPLSFFGSGRHRGGHPHPV